MGKEESMVRKKNRMAIEKARATLASSNAPQTVSPEGVQGMQGEKVDNSSTVTDGQAPSENAPKTGVSEGGQAPKEGGQIPEKC